MQKYGENEELSLDGFMKSQRDFAEKYADGSFDAAEEKLVFDVYDKDKTGTFNRDELRDFVTDTVSLEQCKMFVQGALELEGQEKLDDTALNEHLSPLLDSNGTANLGEVIEYFNFNLSSNTAGQEPEIGESEALEEVVEEKPQAVIEKTEAVQSNDAQMGRVEGDDVGHIINLSEEFFEKSFLDNADL